MNSIKYFTQVTGAQIFAKHNLQLSNLNLTMKSASLSSAILSFFSRHGLYLHPTKDRCSTKPTSTLLYNCCNFGQIFCTNVIQFFSVQNMGHYQLIKCSKYHLVSLLDEKQRSTFDIFVPFLTPLDTLTNSAMVMGTIIWGTIISWSAEPCNLIFVTHLPHS